MGVHTTRNQTVSPNGAERKEIPSPGTELARVVRGGLIARGTTLTEWCRDQGINVSNGRAALYGYSNSDDAQKLRARLIEAAGLLEE